MPLGLAQASDESQKEERMTHILRPARASIAARVFAIAALVASLVVGAQPARADDAQNACQLVDKARLTLESFLADPQMGPPLRTMVRQAKGVLIYPQVLRGAFIFGAAGASGVFLVRNGESDSWAGPAFDSFGQASVGLQAGFDASEVVLVAMTDRGVDALLNTRAKLGANASVAVGPVGAGAEAATANLSADLVSYSRNKGLYAGVSLEGAIVGPRDGLNRAYYGTPVTPTQILMQREVWNPQAAGLIAEVARVAGRATTARWPAGAER
jgi:lipid-binding SYLF domain-containing protein